MYPCVCGFWRGCACVGVRASVCLNSVKIYNVNINTYIHFCVKNNEVYPSICDI